MKVDFACIFKLLFHSLHLSLSVSVADLLSCSCPAWHSLGPLRSSLVKWISLKASKATGSFVLRSAALRQLLKLCRTYCNTSPLHTSSTPCSQVLILHIVKDLDGRTHIVVSDCFWSFSSNWYFLPGSWCCTETWKNRVLSGFNDLI